MLVQLAGAALLLLGSGLVFYALLELEAPSQPRPLVRPHPSFEGSTDEMPLDRAA